ncbi:2OG-Fe dioxygenase-domain-containing protein [Aspergillus pseudonomiae]|uniref:2OG-Fe dioxygenase-domain-containing protein n=1 Tax=Aspergillus pseudonomiae TaxID=1506151 RepID=A0A5N7CXF9_9EURO|nr:2OG-Fe dioxygenase-domain-containing protein [Aspergillus pseudonomiae]KAE8398258.1 2OG-Fe dioxygenase-domain-containing protein [Aspergillus pseudonomiae]
MAEITFPKHWSELGWRHGGNVVTVNFFGEGLNKKHNLERCCGMILRAAEEIGVPITKGAGLGFSVTRIYESSAFLKNVDPYLRISVGVEAAHVELVAQAILQGMEQYCRSATRVNLDVRQRFYDVSFYEAIAIAADIRRRYIQERVVFIPGTRLIPILKAFGAQQEDFEALHSVSDHLGKDPTVDYRTIKNGRFSFDFGEKTIRRLEKQLFTLTVGEGYKRHDSGIARDFPEVTGDLQYNTVVQALMVFKAFIMNEVVVEPREYLDYSSPYWICNLFNVRTFTEKDILGEITLEGVHSDGGDHTMTTFLGCTNMRSDSGVTFVHDQKETTGIPVHQTQSILVKHRLQHRHFLDTILLVDNEAKHSLTPLYPIDASQRATRDMLVLITRKPRLPGHASEMVDQLASHTTLPLQIPFWLPS